MTKLQLISRATFWLLVFIWAVALFAPSQTLFAAQDTTVVSAAPKIPISVFVRDDCRHCRAEKEFLATLQAERSDIEVIYHDLATAEAQQLFRQLTELEKISKVTPTTLVGNTIIQGFDHATTTGRRIQALIEASQQSGKATLTVPEYLKSGGSGGRVESVEGATCAEDSTTCGLTPSGPKELLIRVPFLGAVNLFDYSLPALAVILGFVDGFNPCAMWVLLMFLIILVEVGSRRKMWQVAGLFIVAEAIMYYLILNVWFTAWDFIGLNRIVTPLVGLLAIGGGLFFLYEFCQRDASCKIVSPIKMAHTKHRISTLVKAEMSLLVALGIIGIAFSVNIFEFACSIGIPQAFTKIIELNALSWLYTQGLMALYILFYMLDDFVVFGIAIYSFEKLGVTTKYVKVSNLVGGILMLILGAILLLNPNLLVFI